MCSVKIEQHFTCCISVSCSARIRDEWSRTERALRYSVGLYVVPFSGVALLKHCTGDLDLRLPIGYGEKSERLKSSNSNPSVLRNCHVRTPSLAWIPKGKLRMKKKIHFLKTKLVWCSHVNTLGVFECFLVEHTFLSESFLPSTGLRPEKKEKECLISIFCREVFKFVHENV